MPATRDGKTWRSQFYYEDWQGVRHKKNKRGFKTKAEAEEWERNFRQQQRKDLDINFENFVEIYFADVENRLRESTIKNKRYSQYRTAIEKWKKETGKEPVAHGIRAKLAEKKQEIQNEQKNKQHTRSQNKNRGAR